MWKAQVEKTAKNLLAAPSRQNITCLILGAVDTGKTTFLTALARRLAASRRIAIIDADVGQSHIGPPATVAWALLDDRNTDLSELPVRGMSFVADITPARHLLQFVAAITKCAQQASQNADLILIDTPGFVKGPAACTLWWTVRQIIQPQFILALHRENELSEILAGLRSFNLRLELIEVPSEIPIKSPPKRWAYRISRFKTYFADSRLYDIPLRDLTTQIFGSRRPDTLSRRLVSLRDGEGAELALGVIVDYDTAGNLITIRAPQVDTSRICCIVVGDVHLDIAGK